MFWKVRQSCGTLFAVHKFAPTTMPARARIESPSSQGIFISFDPRHELVPEIWDLGSLDGLSGNTFVGVFSIVFLQPYEHAVDDLQLGKLLEHQCCAQPELERLLDPVAGLPVDQPADAAVVDYGEID